MGNDIEEEILKRVFNPKSENCLFEIIKLIFFHQNLIKQHLSAVMFYSLIIWDT